MNKKLIQNLGKSTEAILKNKPHDFKKLAKKFEEEAKKKSEQNRINNQKRKEELAKKHMQNKSISIDGKERERNRSSEKEDSRESRSGSATDLKEVNEQNRKKTITFRYINPYELVDGVGNDKNKQREEKERLEVIKLIKQFFEYRERDYHYYTKRRDHKPIEISCLGDFALMTNEYTDYLDQDYLNSYSKQPPNVKNLGRYDCWEDRPGKEWEELCLKSSEEYHGTSPMYDHEKDKFVWNQVTVLKYDDTKMRYSVKFLTTLKDVSRLSLLFNCENKEEFEFRKFLCEKRRQLVDDFTLFTRYVDNVPMELVSTLNPIWEKKITQILTFDTRRLAERFNYLFFQSYQPFIREMTIAKQDYIRQMKRCRILLEMQEPTNIEGFKGRNLERRKFYQKIKTPKLGVVNKSQDFRRHVKGLNANSFWEDKSLAQVMVKFLEECERLKKIKIILPYIEETNLPMTLMEFKKARKEYLKKSEYNIRSKCTYGLKNIIFNDLLDITIPGSKGDVKKFDIYVATKEDYNKSPVRKVLKFFNLILHNKVKELVDHSICAFMSFFRRFSVCKYTNPANSLVTAALKEHYLESGVPLFLIAIKLVPLEKTGKTEKKKKGPSLSKNVLEFEPNLKLCELQLLKSLANIKGFISEEIKDLIKLSIKIVEVEEKKIFEVTDDYPLYKDAYSELKEMIEQSKNEAKQKKEEFKEFMGILDDTAEAYVKSKIGDKKETSKNLDIEKCKVILADLNDMTRKLNTMESQINIPLFRIQTDEIKQLVRDKIKQITSTLLERMKQYCTSRTSDLDKESKERIELLKEEPEKIDRYKVLNDNLMGIKDFVEAKKEELNNVGKILLIIEDQKFDKNEEVIRLFHNLITSFRIPGLILEESKRASEILEMRKLDFNDKLNIDKGQFKIDVKKLEKEFEVIQKVESFDATDETTGLDFYSTIQEFSDQLKIIIEHQSEIKSTQQILNPESDKENEQGSDDLPEFEKLNTINNEFASYRHLWAEDKRTMAEYLNMVEARPLSELKILIPNADKNSTKEIFTYVKELEESRTKVDEVAKKNPYDTTLIKLIQQLKDKLKYFESYNWVVQTLLSNYLKEDDWKEIRNLMNNDEKVGLNATLLYLREKNIDEQRDRIELIKTKAVRRATFAIAFREINAEYGNIVLEPKDERKIGLKKLDDVLLKLDDLGTKLMNIISNPVTQTDSRLKNETRGLNEKIKNVQTLLEEVCKFQSNYLYLEPIFSASEMKTFPNEKTDFNKVHNWWRGIMDSLDQSSWVLASFMDKENYQNLMKYFTENNGQLQKIIRKLNEYLNMKRTDFPRFYFVSDEDLLRILAQSNNPLLVQPHLNKCFEGINHVVFDESNTIIQEMVSNENENVVLESKINVTDDVCRGNVEVWLGQLEDKMKMTMKSLLKASMEDLESKRRIDWIRSQQWPGQVVGIVDQIIWTNNAQKAIIEGSLDKYTEHLNRDLAEVVDLVRVTTSKNLSITLSALIVISVHNRDIIAKLFQEDVNKIDAFEWKSQMRYYFSKEDKRPIKRTQFCPLVVSMITSNLNYGFEYLGNFYRLVITPLTDRCFRTLFGAFQVKYGGAPEGPAGTGKTESVKDLAKCVGVMCNVNNCTEGITIQGMSKFFKGLASSGCWCCFDEFNRIDTEVLSVIAQQILTIQNALKIGLTQFYFEETDKIELKDTCAINITMNPSYTGRNELPDNLKALFRPCAMMVADYNLIAQIKLYSFGFQTAKTLSFKIVSSLKLSSEQLSTQSHYDFGMRSLNAILVAAGNLKKKNPEIEEDRIALRALVDVNIPKFTSNDRPLFFGLVRDLFPTTEILESDLTLLEQEIQVSCQCNNLQPTVHFVKKCIQLYETLNVRHALMVVGRTGMGKTKVIETLKLSITNLAPKSNIYHEVKTTTLNPKSIEQRQLYGFFEGSTQEWKKGLLQVKMTELVDKEKELFKWLIFDGPVDTLWIENMNSLLDDNKKLCLEDSSSIKLAENMNIIFEVDDLKEASPATVSRNGMVLCEQDTIDTNDLIESFSTTLPERYFDTKLVAHFRENSIWITKTITEFIFKHRAEFGLACDKFHLVQNFIDVFDCYMKDYRNKDEILSKDRELNTEKIDNLLISSALIGICGPVKRMPKFQEFLYALVIGNDVNKDFNLGFNSQFSTSNYTWERKRMNSPKLHEIEDIFDNVYVLEIAKWVKWLDIPNKKEFKLSEDLQFNELVIPTPDTIKMGWLISMVVPMKKHLLFTGPTGTGKTLTIISSLMSNYDNDFYSYIKMSMTAQTTANFAQEVIEKKLQKSYRKFAPASGKKGVVFVDDLNMPQKEKYGAQPPIELLRQWMDVGGWYDLQSDNKDFVQVLDISFLASMGSVASGRTVTQRYLRHFLIHYAECYSKDTMHKIFSQVVNWFFLRTKTPCFSDKVLGYKDNLINATIQMYMEVSSQFRATPAKTHYQFNLRDVGRVFQGIARSNARTIRDELELIRLWIHECERVFKDRLVSDEDRAKYEIAISSVMKVTMKREYFPYSKENILFGDYVNMIHFDNDPKKPFIEKQYCELSDKNLLKATLEEKLSDYNREVGNRSESGGPLNLVLFSYAIDHISRILRIISTYNGHAVLVGVGGSGRTCLTTLSAYIRECVLFQVENEWRDSIKQMMKELGNKEVVFLVSEGQITDKYLEDLNNMLNNGEIPNLIESQDLQMIKDNIPLEFTQGRKLQTDSEIMTSFIEQCKARIHVCLCLSPIGENFRKRILMFPSLVSCTTIDWFLPWPEDALSSVAEYYLQGAQEIDQSLLESIINICVEMQSTVSTYSLRYFQELRRYNYVTPMSFIELLNLFKSLLKKRTVEINNEINRYGNGLDVLTLSEKISAEMGIKIQKLEPELRSEKERCNEQVAELTIIKNQLLQEEQEGKIAEEAAVEVERDASAKNEKAMASLAVIEQTRKNAIEKLDKIDQKEILEFKKYKYDHNTNEFCKFMCLLMIPKNPHPKATKNDANPREPPIKNYLAHAVANCLNCTPGEFLKKMKADYTRMPRENMVELKNEFETNTWDPKSKSETMQNLYFAIKDHNNIYFINEEYIPIKHMADAAAKVYQQSQETLRLIREKLAHTQKMKQDKEDEYAKKLKQIEDLEAMLKKCKTRLQNAHELNASLGQEKEQWEIKRKNLQTNAVNIIGDIIISCGIIAYLGAFTKSYREEIIEKWTEKVKSFHIPLSAGENKSPSDIMRGILGDDMEIEQWKSQELPNDNFSIDNAIIIKQSRRFCLLIDPQNQALEWIRRKIKDEHDSQIVVTDRKKKERDIDRRQDKKKKDVGIYHAYYSEIKPTMENKVLLETTIDCLFEGRTLIYENVGEQLCSQIAPVYRKEFYYVGKQCYVNINKQQYDVNDNFRFYIITQLAKPHYHPEICVALTLVNFTVTEEGLEDQMLNFLVEKEDHALNQLRKDCISNKNTFERKKKEMERDILSNLTLSIGQTTGDNTILDNSDLIEKLRQSKESTKEITSILKKQQETDNKITAKRGFLRPVATHVAQLFFTVCDLSNIEPVYQYSLKFYRDIFRIAIDSTPKDVKESNRDDPNRLELLKKAFNSILYDKICMSLFEKDKIVFSFLMQVKIKMITMSVEEKVSYSKDVRLLVTGGTGKESDVANPSKESPENVWLSTFAWNAICEMAQSSAKFAGLEKSLIAQTEEWKKVLTSSNPYEETFPVPFHELQDFYKLIILRIIRPDKTIPALRQYISTNLGEKYTTSPTFDIGKAYDESRNKTPILFIISPGADPIILVDKLCKREGKNFNEDVKSLSLGKGQEETAQKVIDNAQIKDKEKWILLQNCHLAKSFMSILEKKIEEIQDTGSSFRMFLTALPSTIIPISIIQDSIKITNEPPQGLKQSIGRTFSTIDERFYESLGKQKAIFKRFVFGFCFFHALVLERRKYRALGWNIPYEFSNADLSISVTQLRNFLEDYEDIQYDALIYMIAEANYGGRVTDPSDRRLIKILFMDICNERILDDNYLFSGLKEYPVPIDGKYEDHEKFIAEQIPKDDTPAVFGLHANADITFAINETNSVFEAALYTLPRTIAAKTGKSSDDDVKARAVEILGKLPKQFEVDDVRMKHPIKHEESLNSVLHQELMRFNNLLSIVKSSMKSLRDAILGEVVMTSEIEMIYQSVFDNKVPVKIEKVSYPSVMPLSSWINDFLERINFLQKWIDEGIPSTFWISAFFFTHSFLTGILQNYARKEKIAIDELKFDFTVMSNLSEYNLEKRPEDGCYIYGLYIEGARWNSELRLLDESLPKNLFPSMPHVWFKPSRKKDNEKKQEGVYECPVYRTTKRSGELLTTGQSTNFLIHMFLPFNSKLHKEEHWVERGTAVLCSLNQ